MSAPTDRNVRHTAPPGQAKLARLDKLNNAMVDELTATKIELSDLRDALNRSERAAAAQDSPGGGTDRRMQALEGRNQQLDADLRAAMATIEDLKKFMNDTDFGGSGAGAAGGGGGGGGGSAAPAAMGASSNMAELVAARRECEVLRESLDQLMSVKEALAKELFEATMEVRRWEWRGMECWLVGWLVCGLDSW